MAENDWAISLNTISCEKKKKKKKRLDPMTTRLVTLRKLFKFVTIFLTLSLWKKMHAFVPRGTFRKVS